MIHIHTGSKVKALRGAGRSIRINDFLYIKKIEYFTNKKIKYINIDLPFLKNYHFRESTFVYYFGDFVVVPDKINKNIKIL
jgi:hypothetical protein